MDPVLEAQTILGFVDALNQKYQLTLPNAFPENSPMQNLWKRTPIQVTPGNGEGNSYIAQGILTFIPFNFGQKTEHPLLARIIVTVRV